MPAPDAVQAILKQAQPRRLPRRVLARLPHWRLPHWSREVWVWAAALAALALILMSAHSASFNLDRDEGAFLTIAQGILHGRLPYRDMFDQKGPAIYYVLALVLVVTRGLTPLQQVLMARVLVVLVNVFTAGGLLVLGRRWWRLEVGVLAALLWLFGLDYYGGNQLFTEPFAVAATVGALLVASGGTSVRRAIGAGALLALASMFKQTAILALPGVAVLLLANPTTDRLWTSIRRLSRAQLLRLAAFIAGVAAAWLVVTAYFAARGALGPYLDQVIVANIRYPADSLADIRARVSADIATYRVVWYAAAIAVAYGAVRWLGIFGRRRWPTTGELAVVLVGGLSLIPFKSHAYSHYWIQILPFAALLAAAAITGLVGWYASSRMNEHMARHAEGHLEKREAGDAPPVPPRNERSAASVSTPGALILPVLIMLIIVLSTGRSLKPSWPVTASPALQQQADAGVWLDTYAPPGASMLVAPAQPEYYFLSQRLPPASYVYILPVNATGALINQFTDDLRQTRFDVVVWSDAPDLANQMSCANELVASCAALVQRYHVIAMNASLRLTIYVPNRPSS